MISVSINPSGIQDEYLRCLNLCFGNWGDRQSYHWYFERRTSYTETDLIVLRENDKLAAGSAVSYRRVAFADGTVALVGIMTGSWTLPQFRGRGHFTQIIKESLRLTAEAGGSALLAFVTEENGSFRQLAKAGAALVPASYLLSTPQTQEARAGHGNLHRLEKSGPVISEVFARLSDDEARRYCRFHYSSEHDFRSQFIDRPGETEIFRDSSGCFGIIEKKGETDILQLFLADVEDEAALTKCLGSFLFHALCEGRKLFLYSTLPTVARACTRLGISIKRGFLTIMTTDGAASEAAHYWTNCSWNVQSGDRV